MLDNLAIISKLIEEHQTIRGHTKLVGYSITDQEAMIGLTRARPRLDSRPAGGCG